MRSASSLKQLGPEVSSGFKRAGAQIRALLAVGRARTAASPAECGRAVSPLANGDSLDRRWPARDPEPLVALALGAE
jgi:hypothetical protein